MDRILSRFWRSAIVAAMVLVASTLAGCAGYLQTPGDDPEPEPGTPPSVLSTTPVADSTDVAINTAITVRFTKKMDQSTMIASNITLEATGTPASPALMSVSGETSYNDTINTLTFTPAADLASFTFYTATVSAAVKDTDGNEMGTDYSWQFRTADVLAPTVVGTFPDDAATDVEEFTDITATFSEDIDEDTVDDGSFLVNKGGDAVSGTTGANGDEASFTPDSDLRCGGTYTATVTTDITDTAGISLAADYSWDFTMAPGRSARRYDETAGDGELGYGLDLTDDGGYITAGLIFRNLGANWSGFVAKFDASGEMEWQRELDDPGGVGNDYFRYVEQTSDGGYVAIGNTSMGSGGSDMWVVKFDADGVVEWQNAYGRPNDDGGYEIHQISGGGYIAAGYVDVAGNRDGWVVELDASGAIADENMYGITGPTEELRSIKQTVDGDYIAAGYTDNGVGGGDFWVIRLTAGYAVTWSNYYQAGLNLDEATSVAVIPDGSGFMVFGNTFSFGAGAYDLWTLKITNFGPVEWESAYGGAANDFASNIVPLASGNFLMVGTTQSIDARQDGWFIEIEPGTGNVQWANAYGLLANYNEAFTRGVQRADGGLVALGLWEDVGAGTPSDLWLVNTDGDGEIDATCTYITNFPPTRNTTVETTNALAVVPAGSGAATVATNAAITDITSTETGQCASPCEPL